MRLQSRRKMKRGNSTEKTIFIIGIILIVSVFGFIAVIRNWMLTPKSISGNTYAERSTSSACLASFGTYNGYEYRSTTSTIGKPKCLIESKWMKLMQHTVRTDDGHIIDDWLFIDYHDRINVLVEDYRNEDHFLVLNQTKYSLEGQTSLAVVGGIIEPKEQPEEAARREVQEEMSILCHNFHFLGRFLTDVNRGIGWVNSFLAQNCYLEEEEKDGHFTSSSMNVEEVGVADFEQQDILSLPKKDLQQYALQGKFLEVQWSNTVSLAILHLNENQL